MQSPTSTVRSNATQFDTIYINTDYARTDTLPGIKRDWSAMSSGLIELPESIAFKGGYTITRVVWTLHRSPGVQWKSAKQDIFGYGGFSNKHGISQTTANKVKVVFGKPYDFPIPGSLSDLPWFFLYLNIQATGTRGSYMTADLDSVYITHNGVPAPVKLVPVKSSYNNCYCVWQTKAGENQTVKFLSQ